MFLINKAKKYRKFLFSVLFLLILAIILFAVADITRPLANQSNNVFLRLTTYTPTVTTTPGWWTHTPTPKPTGGNK